MSLQADDNEVVATAVPVTASDDNVRNLSSLAVLGYHIQNTYRTKKVKSLPKRKKRERSF